ncbi:hypothetical protein BHM03_00002500, partial [Ensete ventricosum]
EARCGTEDARDPIQRGAEEAGERDRKTGVGVQSRRRRARARRRRLGRHRHADRVVRERRGQARAAGGRPWPRKVEHGFLAVYTSKSERTRYNKTSASEQVMAEIKRLVKHYRRQGEEVSLTITGHSLGGALALHNAYEAASAMPDLPVSVISIGAPRVGNAAFGERLKEMNVKVLRAVVKQDVVPKMPGILFNEGLKRLESVTGKLEWVYSHVGVELGLDVRSSQFLKRGIDVAGFHNLEAYLHLVDGFRSSDDGFRSSFKRDLALVNKAGGMLRDELKIPPCWYQVANKGMVCHAHGRWMKPARETEHIPSPHAQTTRSMSSLRL